MIKQLIENAFKCWKEESDTNNNKLTLASKQSLLALVRKEINRNQRMIVYSKQSCKSLYQLSDKENSESLIYFNTLNKIRDEIRITKKRIKQLARIAKELKMSMK